MTDSFFDELREWSEIKLRLLQKYLRPYCYKLGSRHGELFYVDAFAGPGTYRKDNRKGSPLIAADWARQFCEERRKFSLKCIFVEYDEIYFRQLRKDTQDLESSGLVYNFHGKFEDKIGQILAIIGYHPAFFFIDPFGISPIKHEVLRPIFERGASTELLINFSLKGLQRLAGNVNAETVSGRGKRAAQTKVQVLSQVLNTGNWINIWCLEPRQMEREQKILNLYEDNLRHYFDYVFSYPIRANSKEHPKYFLVFTSRNFDAVEIMNDFICSEEEQLRSDTYNTYGMNDLFQMQEKEQLFQEIKDESYLFAQKNKRTTLKAIQKSLIPSRFGQMKVKEYSHAVKELVNEGYIRPQLNKTIKDDGILEFVSN